MKSFKRKLLEKKLRWMTQAILAKYKPMIVGISGSVGKTSTKEAVYLALKVKYKVRKNSYNYNNEVGLPLTVIGASSGDGSIVKWSGVFLKWIWMMLIRMDYPQVLVLEMGVDRPGDMEYLTSFIKPHVSILTNVSSSHLEFFKSVDYIAREKRKLIEVLAREDFAVLNVDDTKIKSMQNRTKAELITFGFSDDAAVKASDAVFNYQDALIDGLSFKLNYKGKLIPIRLKHVLAKHHIYAILAAISAGIALKINLVDLSKAMEEFLSPTGRMNLIPGIKNSQLIDDTYNASPFSTIAALDMLMEVKAGRKIAVLGDMLELGDDLISGHNKVVQKVFTDKIDMLFAVGSRMKAAAEELSRHADSTQVFYFDDPVNAGKKLQELINQGDLILVKGSQGMRMEMIVEEVMAEPVKAGELLCRQTEGWKEKEFEKY